MNWIVASLLSALFLGCYNLGVKQAVRDSDVLTLLFSVNLVGALFWLAVMACTSTSFALVPLLEVEPMRGAEHLQVLVKSMLMAASWLLTYAGLKRLPLSIAAPVQSTGPIWVLLGGVTLFNEQLSLWQWVGVCITLGSFIALSFVGSQEGIRFYRNRGILFVVLGSLLMGVTGLYDKYLFGQLGFRPATVQAWFTFYMVLILLPVVAIRRICKRQQAEHYLWRWSILGIVVSLMLADFIYYHALQSPSAMIAVVSSLRRGDVVVAFVGGILFFGERVTRAKALTVSCLLAGIVITVLGQG